MIPSQVLHFILCISLVIIFFLKVTDYSLDWKCSVWWQFVKNAWIEPPFGESISINGTQKIVIIFTQGASSTTWNDISIIKAKIQFQNVLYLSYMNNSM